MTGSRLNVSRSVLSVGRSQANLSAAGGRRGHRQQRASLSDGVTHRLDHLLSIAEQPEAAVDETSVLQLEVGAVTPPSPIPPR